MRQQNPQLSSDEIEIIEAGRDFREMKATNGWRRLTKMMVAACNVRQEDLRSGLELEDRATLRLLDRWRAYEDFYALIIDEVDGSIAKLAEKERGLREEGILYPELSIGPTAQKGEG